MPSARSRKKETDPYTNIQLSEYNFTLLFMKGNHVLLFHFIIITIHKKRVDKIFGEITANYIVFILDESI